MGLEAVGKDTTSWGPGETGIEATAATGTGGSPSTEIDASFGVTATSMKPKSARIFAISRWAASMSVGLIVVACFEAPSSRRATALVAAQLLVERAWLMSGSARSDRRVGRFELGDRAEPVVVVVELDPVLEVLVVALLFGGFGAGGASGCDSVGGPAFGCARAMLEPPIERGDDQEGSEDAGAAHESAQRSSAWLALESELGLGGRSRGSRGGRRRAGRRWARRCRTGLARDGAQGRGRCRRGRGRARNLGRRRFGCVGVGAGRDDKES